MGKCQHWSKPLSSSVQSLQHVVWLTHGIPWNPMVMRRESDCFMFEGGNLLNLNLTPVTNIPWKLCNFTSCATQLQSHICQHQSDLLFHFWGNATCVHNTCKKNCLKFVLLKNFCMVLVLSLHGWCNFQACYIIIMNECCNKHICNNSEGTKVSFMLKEIMYGKNIHL